MKLTEMLKAWLVANCGIKADATDDEYRKAAGDAFASGKLTPAKYEKMTITDDDKAAVASLDALTETMKGLANSGTKDQPTGHSDMSKTIGRMGGTPTDTSDKAHTGRVKDVAEKYDTKRESLHYPESTSQGTKHFLAGQRVMNQGTAMSTSSDQDKAIAGAWAKFQIQSERHGRLHERAFESLSEHEQDLLHWACEHAEWDASKDDRTATFKGYPGGTIKALIDDATSGGLEAAPIVFDDMVIQVPLLYGELFPLINVVPLERGRRVEGVSTGTVTGSWGGVDDSAVNLFNTASYVSAFDTTIFRWEGTIRIGLDFLEDTPIDFGAHITQQYGERLLEDLDDVIATGNGTTQPEGIMVKSGTTSVAFSSATSLGNYESLRFAVTKSEHGTDVKASAVFLGNETSYRRIRAEPVGAADERRLFGMDYDGYSIMERPYKINESIANTKIAYIILKRYRMYRRKGIAIRTATEGDTLVRNNEMLIIAMARYGGQLERGAVAAVTTDAPS